MKNRFKVLSDDIIIVAEVLSQKLEDADAGMKKRIQEAHDRVHAVAFELEK